LRSKINNNELLETLGKKGRGGERGFRGLLNLQLLNLIKQFFSQLGSTVGFLFTLGN
jgi:hypothetical protein